MKETCGILGVCSGQAALQTALARLRQSGYRDVEVFSPVPMEDLEATQETPKSPVRFYTLLGGIAGLLAGLALTVWTSLSWPLLTGGKPIVSIPPFLIIAFELTILLGGLFTAVGFLTHARLLRPYAKKGFDTRFTGDKFGLFITCEIQQSAEVKDLLLTAGLEEASVETT